MEDGPLGIMRCPSCGGEFRPSISECPDCEVELVPDTEDPRVPEPPPAYALVPVLATGNPALLAVAESLLIDAGIAFEKTGEGLQDLFGWGRLGTGFNPVVGPAVLRVHDEDEATARELLAELEDCPGQDWESLGDDRAEA
jgi:hypothetical protein